MENFDISLTKSNKEWIKNQVVNKNYSSINELVNYLIRINREGETRNRLIISKLVKGEKGGFTTLTKDQILAKAKAD